MLNATAETGIVGQLEIGYRFLPDLGGFAYGQLSSLQGWSAGAGVKVTF